MLFLQPMHELASTLASLILSPLNWILFLVLLSFVVKKTPFKKSLRIVAVGLFLLFSNAWLLDLYARSFQPKPLQLASNANYSCGIVPGGFASPDNSGNAVFNSTADRFIQVLKLYKQGHVRHILLAGGNGKKQLGSFREAAWVKGQLMILGVPDSVIFIEDASNNTAENVLNSKKILLANQLQPPYLLISSAQHLPRASALFERNGLQVVPYPCSYIAGQGINTWRDFIPNLGTLQTWDIFLKESLGYYWYRS